MIRKLLGTIRTPARLRQGECWVCSRFTWQHLNTWHMLICVVEDMPLPHNVQPYLYFRFAALRLLPYLWLYGVHRICTAGENLHLWIYAWHTLKQNVYLSLCTSKCLARLAHASTGEDVALLTKISNSGLAFVPGASRLAHGVSRCQLAKHSLPNILCHRASCWKCSGKQCMPDSPNYFFMPMGRAGSHMCQRAYRHNQYQLSQMCCASLPGVGLVLMSSVPSPPECVMPVCQLCQAFWDCADETSATATVVVPVCQSCRYYGGADLISPPIFAVSVVPFVSAIWRLCYRDQCQSFNVCCGSVPVVPAFLESCCGDQCRPSGLCCGSVPVMSASWESCCGDQRQLFRLIASRVDCSDSQHTLCQLFWVPVNVNMAAPYCIVPVCRPCQFLESCRSGQSQHCKCGVPASSGVVISTDSPYHIVPECQLSQALRVVLKIIMPCRAKVPAVPLFCASACRDQSYHSGCVKCQRANCAITWVMVT